MKRLSRRHLLHGAGAALALPWLAAFEARAQAAPPRRLVLVFSPNGVVQDRWAPPGAEFTGSLAPLAPHQSKLTVVRNVDLGSTLIGPGDGHQKGIAHLWTGARLQEGSLFGRVDWASAPSVDQLAADVLGTTTPMRSLELGVHVTGARINDRMCYRAAGQPLPPLTDPRDVFDRIFGGASDPLAAERRRRQRKSVLDAVLGELKSVSAMVDAGDRRRLDAHATTVREVEQRLDLLPQPTAACVTPARPNPQLGITFEEEGQLQVDLLALALACDVTRVASLQWSSAASPVVFSWLGLSTEHHELSHRPSDDAASAAELAAIDTWYAAQFARLVARLDAMSEGAGTVLDHSLVLWGNELGVGNTHSPVGAPFVLAGSAGDALRVGQVVNAQHAAHNQVLLAAMQGLGVPVASVGEASLCPGPLPGLLV